MLGEREALSEIATLGELFKLRVPEDLMKRKATRLGCPANTRSRRSFPIDVVRQLLREVFIYSEALSLLLVLFATAALLYIFALAISLLFAAS